MAYKVTRFLFLIDCAVGVIKIFIHFKNEKYLIKERKVPFTHQYFKVVVP
jgi:hypothetical protein